MTGDNRNGKRVREFICEEVNVDLFFFFNTARAQGNSS